jgi:hypothetical protein
MALRVGDGMPSPRRIKQSIVQKFPQVWGIPLKTCPLSAEVARGFPTRKFRKPRFVFNLLLQNGERQIVGQVVLAGRHIADGHSACDGAAFGFHQNFQHRLHVAWVGGKVCGGTGGNIVKSVHAVGQIPAQCVNPGYQRLKVIAVFYACVFGDLFEPFTVQTDEVDAQDCVINNSR